MLSLVSVHERIKKFCLTFCSILYSINYNMSRIEFFFFLFILNFGYIIKKIKGIYIPQVLINRISISGTHKMWEKILLRFYKCIQTLHSPMHAQFIFLRKQVLR